MISLGEINKKFTISFTNLKKKHGIPYGERSFNGILLYLMVSYGLSWDSHYLKPNITQPPWFSCDWCPRTPTPPKKKVVLHALGFATPAPSIWDQIQERHFAHGHGLRRAEGHRCDAGWNHQEWMAQMIWTNKTYQKNDIWTGIQYKIRVDWLY